MTWAFMDLNKVYLGRTLLVTAMKLWALRRPWCVRGHLTLMELDDGSTTMVGTVQLNLNGQTWLLNGFDRRGEIGP